MRNCYMQMRNNIKNNRLFGRHSNLKQYLRLSMPLYLGEKKLLYIDRRWILLGRLIAYIKVVLFNIKYGCYIYRKIERGEKIGCAKNTMSGVMNEQANDKKQRENYIYSYNFLKKPLFINTKSQIAVNSICNSILCEIISQD